MLGDHAAAVGPYFGDGEPRIAQVRQLVGERVVAAGGLRAALDHVPGHHGSGESVQVFRAPAVPGRGRPDDQRGVGDPRADDDVRSGPQRGRNPPAAEVGVRGDRRDTRLGQRLAGVGVRQLVTSLGELAEPAEQVVALHVGDLRRQAEPRGDLPQPVSEPGRVQAARVDHDRDATVQAGADDLLELTEKGPGVAAAGILLPGLPQDQHRELGQVVAGQNVDRPTVDHLPRRRSPVPIETGAVGDPHRTPLRHLERRVIVSSACAASRAGHGRWVPERAGRADGARAGLGRGRRRFLRSGSSRTSPRRARSCG